jgi:hypothetical protein
MDQKTLPDCTESQFGFRVSCKVGRFKSPGWFAIGKTYCNCPGCGDGLWGFRKPYKDGELLYWALICTECKAAYERSDLSDVQKKLLKKSSEVRINSTGFSVNSKVNVHSNKTHTISLDSNFSTKSNTNLCLSCKHAKKVKQNTICQALVKNLLEIGPLKNCVHYNNFIEGNSTISTSIEMVMKNRANQEQQPDKFATDKFKFFNKIKRK